MVTCAGGRERERERERGREGGIVSGQAECWQKLELKAVKYSHARWISYHDGYEQDNLSTPPDLSGTSNTTSDIETNRLTIVKKRLSDGSGLYISACALAQVD